MLCMRKTSVDSESLKGKKCQHILGQTPLVTAFVTSKQDFFSTSASLSLSLFFSLAFTTPTGQDC